MRRNLAAGEIIGQVLALLKRPGDTVETSERRHHGHGRTPLQL